MRREKTPAPVPMLALRFASVLAVAALAASAQAAPRPLVHPDTLPSVMEEWALEAPAQSEAPDGARFTLDGGTLYLHDNAQAQLLAIEAATGRVTWFASLPRGRSGPFAFRPYVHEGRRLIVAGSGSLYYVNAHNGQVIWRAPLPGAGTGQAFRIADLLVFATVALEGPTARGGPALDLYALNLKHGKFAWHKRFGGASVRLLADEQQIYLTTPDGDLMALTRDGGDPIWRARLDGRPGEPAMVGGRIVVAVRGTGTRVVAIETQKGMTDWEFRSDTARVVLVPTAKALLVAGDDGSVVALDAASGREVWRVDTLLDARVRDISGAADEKRAYLMATYERGGSLLSLIDLAKGKLVATANGLPAGAVTAAVAGKAMIVDTAQAVLRAFRLDRSERPKRKTVTPAEYAKEMAATAPNMKSPEEVRALGEKIARLGPAASPEIVPLTASSDPNVVAAAIIALGGIGEKRGAAELVAALDRERKRKPQVVEPFDLVALIARALGRIGEPRAVAALDQTMNDREMTADARRSAFVALGRIASPPALAAIAAFKAPLSAGSGKWDPVPISNALEFPVGSDPDPAAWPEDARARTSLAVTGADGKKIVASLSPYLGGYNDVWLWRSDDGVKWQRPLFTGLTHATRSARQQIELVRIDVRPTGVNVTYRLPEKTTRRTARFEWAALEQDADGDGLTDLCEKRLGTRPDEKDSDGDGLGDAEDVNPVAPATNQPSDDQLLYREAFFAYEAFFRSRGLVVVDRGTEARIEYFGRRDPIVTLRRRAMQKIQEEAGLGAVDYVGFGGPFATGATRGEASPEPKYNDRRDEVVVGFDVFRGGKSALGMNVTLRKLGGNWVVTGMEEAWRL